MNDVSTLIIQDERTVLQSCAASSPAVVLFACYREEKTCWMACYQVAESERELTRGDGRGVAQATKRQGNLPDRALKVSVSSPEARPRRCASTVTGTLICPSLTAGVSERMSRVI